MYRLTFVIFLMFISLPSFGHAGHDHSDPMASLIHLAWIAPLFIVAFLVVNKLIKHNSSLKNKQ
jgi:hypothetical protein